MTFSYSDSEVATLSLAGFYGPLKLTADAPGSTWITAEWTDFKIDTFCSESLPCECEGFDEPAYATAPVTAQDCSHPTSEITIFNGWNSFDPTKANFVGTLLPGPLTLNFTGRRIYEEGTGGFGPETDSCWYQNSGRDPFWKPTNSPDQFWTVRSTANQYGDDTIGYGRDSVHVYQDNMREPCGTLFEQRMRISCYKKRNEFKINYIAAAINKVNGQRKLAVRRDDQIPERNYR